MEGTALSRDLVDAYFSAVDWLRGVLGRAEVVEVWDRPSAVAGYSVGGLAAHAVHSVVWLEQLLKDAEPSGLRPVSIGEFFGVNRVDEGDGADPFADALRGAAEAFAATGAPLVTAACTQARDELVELLDAASSERAVPVVRVPGGQVPLSDYLRTRVLEVVVHGDDVVSSVPGLTVPDPPSGAVEVSLGVCLEMARARLGDMGALRAFTRAERALPDALRVL
ncbi:MAG TPA: maleylpyruvate isomerase N-terminal domain-containing protein [Acidimicrobiales bacterium]|nr:maleylpyruvate isomerase N-terminal domain-containing protein [Acidimicrobiales bacterium]